MRLLAVHPNAYVLTTTDGTAVDIPREPLDHTDDAHLRAFINSPPLRRTAPDSDGTTGRRRRNDRVHLTPGVPAGRHSLTTPYRRRARRFAFGCALAALALLTVGPILGAASDDSGPVLVGVLLAVGFLANAVLWWLASRRTPSDPVGTPRRYTITDQAFQADDAGQSIRWSWSIVKWLQEWPETYLLYQDGGSPFAIPRDTLTKDQERRLRALFEERGLIAP